MISICYRSRRPRVQQAARPVRAIGPALDASEPLLRLLLRLRRREPNLIDDADHARNPARVGFGAFELIGPIDDAGYGHPSVFHLDLHPVRRDSEVPITLCGGTARSQCSAFNTSVLTLSLCDMIITLLPTSLS